MRLLKIVVVIFGIYFVRRFLQLYRAMKQIQLAQKMAQEEQGQKATKSQNKSAIDADFKVINH